jgi:hypothetical protein
MSIVLPASLDCCNPIDSSPVLIHCFLPWQTKADLPWEIIFPEEEGAIFMSGKQPSHLQKAASKAQSLADRGAAGKKRASELQSDADRAAVPKHGL